jgi:plastocyanin
MVQTSVSKSLCLTFFLLLLIYPPLTIMFNSPKLSLARTITKSLSNSTNASNITTSTAGVPNTAIVSIVQGSSSPTNPRHPKFYDPSPASVSVGGAVTWINKDNTTHTVTSVSGSYNMFDSKCWLCNLRMLKH